MGVRRRKFNERERVMSNRGIRLCVVDLVTLIRRFYFHSVTVLNRITWSVQ